MTLDAEERGTYENTTNTVLLKLDSEKLCQSLIPPRLEWNFKNIYVTKRERVEKGSSS